MQKRKKVDQASVDRFLAISFVYLTIREKFATNAFFYIQIKFPG